MRAEIEVFKIEAVSKGVHIVFGLAEEGEGVRVALRRHVQSLLNVGLHIDEHLSLDLLLLSLSLSLLFLHRARSLIHLITLSVLEILRVLIICSDVNSVVVSSDVVHLQLTGDDLRDQVSQLVRVVQDVVIRCCGLEGLRLSNMRLLVVSA